MWCVYPPKSAGRCLQEDQPATSPVTARPTLRSVGLTDSGAQRSSSTRARRGKEQSRPWAARHELRQKERDDLDEALVRCVQQRTHRFLTITLRERHTDLHAALTDAEAVVSSPPPWALELLTKPQVAEN